VRKAAAKFLLINVTEVLNSKNFVPNSKFFAPNSKNFAPVPENQPKKRKKQVNTLFFPEQSIAGSQ